MQINGGRISGRRNALGTILGKRTRRWQSGCPKSFSVFFRTNCHALPNYRLPPNAKTHDNANCRRGCELDERSVKVVEKLAQRASREMTGYHCGYTFKPQRTAKGTLDNAVQSLTFFHHTLDSKKPALKYRRTATKMVADLYHNTTARAATEEFNLSMNADEEDVMNAEFLRTFQNNDFYGGALLRRLNLETQRQHVFLGKGGRNKRRCMRIQKAFRGFLQGVLSKTDSST